MDTIFMNSENRKTRDHHRLLLYFCNKRNLKRKDKYIDLSNFTIHYKRKNLKKLT